ncbi:MAG: ankyrin repeat domain-containing protein [Alphaproteobacteria bacterium]
MRQHDRYETQGWSAERWMWQALHEGDLNDVKQVFADRKPNPDCAEKYDGDTPLGFAIRNGDIALVQLLIAEGAEVTRPMGYQQFTPLHVAADKGDTAIVNLLLKCCADANSRTRYGETPTHRAAWGGHNKALAALLTAKGNVDAQNDMMQTPMHCAISSNKPETVKILLEWNADITLTDLDGQDAKTFATKLQDMLMTGENPQLTHLQFMEHARNIDKIHEYLDHADTVHDCTNIEHMKGAFNKGAKRGVSAMKPLNLKPANDTAADPKKPPKTGFTRQ